jgi:NAD(P)-dependent dehydrogenase (short-subunit alcohol dehydrogenase family)
MTSWKGKRVLVTGASSGIGAALARELSSVGAVVAMCARRTGLLEDVLVACRRSVPGCRAWTVDLSRLEGIDAFVREVEDHLGGIDVLINNAAATSHGPATSLSPEDAEYLMRTNYLAPVRLTLAALPAMQRQGAGTVIAISSMAARMSTPGEAAYAASKAALSAFFEALAGELWDSPVRFHLVYPALVDLTPDLDGDDSLAVDSTGIDPIPAPVLARAVLRQVDSGNLELYFPQAMKKQVAHRARDVASSVEFMADLYHSGRLP